MILSNRENNNLDKVVFIISLLMLISRKYITSFFSEYEYLMSIQSYLLYMPLGILLLNFMRKKYHTKREVFCFAIFAVLYLLTRNGSILIFVLMALAVQTIDDKYIVKSYLNIHMIFFISYVTLALLFPEFGSRGEYHYKLKEGVRVLRGTFGLLNPNAAFYYLLPIYAGYIYLRFDKYNIFDRILMISITLLVYGVTSSRTGFITIVLGLVFIEIIKLIDFKKQLKLSKTIKFIPLMLAIVSILIGTIFSNVEILNKALSSRPKNWYIYLISRGNMLSLFGNKYTDGVRNMNPMDNSYIYLLCFLGIITFALVMYIIYKGLEAFTETNNKNNITIAMLFFVYGLAENILLEISLNFTLLLIIKRFISSDNRKKIDIYNYKSYIEDIGFIKSNRIKK